MLGSFGNLKSVIQSNRRFTESFVFFLHYRVTFLILLFCCILISTEIFMGPKINCLSNPSGEIRKEFLNNYCWATSTYSVTSSYLKEVGVQVPHPGIEGSEKKSEYEYRNFYQYVHIVLFIQAVLFYIPHMLWKSIQPNFISRIHEAVGKIVPNSKDVSNELTLRNVSVFIEERRGLHKVLAFKYFMCELLATLNILVQTYLLDVFFHGKFLHLGLLFKAYYNSEIFSDPLRLFPVVTLCEFRKYGPSGDIDVIDALCVLPINAINGKIFLCLWIWFTVLLILSIGNLIYLMMCMVLPEFRVLLLRIRPYLLKGPRNIEFYIKLMIAGDFGDWFVLSALENNVDELRFCRMTENILSKVDSLENETNEA